MVWTQNYAPFDSVWLDRWSQPAGGGAAGFAGDGPRLCVAGRARGLACAVLIAMFAFVPREVDAVGSPGRPAWWATVLAAAGNGAAFGLLPIGWIVLAAIFLYTLTVETGQFEIVKHSVLSLSDDRRVQALLIAFCFGAFVEGAAGFGTPVAISAALMVGPGFRPLHAAGLALIANTAPVAFGALRHADHHPGQGDRAG